MSGIVPASAVAQPRACIGVGQASIVAARIASVATDNGSSRFSDG